MELNFVFKTGWAGQASDFEPLKQSLKALLPDARFFDWHTDVGNPVIQAQTWIGIGHSLGFADLVSANHSWQGLVSLQGFTHFRSAAVDSCAGTPSRLLRLMQKRFSQTPEKVVVEFLETAGFAQDRCKCNALTASGQQALSDGLQRLYDLNVALPQDVKVLAIASQDDAIVPANLTQYCFSGKPDVELYWLANGSRHALHQHQAQACAALLVKWLGR